MRKLGFLLVLVTYFLLYHACYGAILLNDTWADGTRDDTNLPDESAVWAGDDGDVTVSVGSLQYGRTAYTDSHKLWTYFMPDGSPIKVAPSQKLIATVKFIPRGLYVSDAENFRMGLYTDPTDSQVHSDTDDDGGGDGDPWTDSTGYGVRVTLSSGAGDNPQVGKRVDMTNTSLLGSSGAYSWASGGADVENLVDETLHTAILELDYVSENEMVVTWSLLDATDSVVTTHSLTDDGTNHLDPLSNPTPIYTEFDHLFFRFSMASGTADIIDFQNIKVELVSQVAYDPIPEDESNTNLPIDSLSWTNPDVNDITCTVYLGTDPNRLLMDSVETGVDEASIDINSTNFPNFYDLQVGQTYHWVVDCNAPGADFPPGEYWWFTATQNVPPDVNILTVDPAADVWLGQLGEPNEVTVNLDGDVTDVDGPYPIAILWTQIDTGAPDVTIDPNDVEDTSITFTERGNYQFMLTADDGIADPVSDTVRIIVGDTACDASHIKTGDPYNDADVTGPEGQPDCIVDLLDFAELIANNWLDCTDTVTECGSL